MLLIYKFKVLNYQLLRVAVRMSGSSCIFCWLKNKPLTLKFAAHVLVLILKFLMWLKGGGAAKQLYTNQLEP